MTTIFGLADTYVRVTFGSGTMCTAARNNTLTPVYATTMRFDARNAGSAPVRYPDK